MLQHFCNRHVFWRVVGCFAELGWRCRQALMQFLKVCFTNLHRRWRSLLWPTKIGTRQCDETVLKRKSKQSSISSPLFEVVGILIRMLRLRVKRFECIKIYRELQVHGQHPNNYSKPIYFDALVYWYVTNYRFIRHGTSFVSIRHATSPILIPHATNHVSIPHDTSPVLIPNATSQ